MSIKIKMFDSDFKPVLKDGKQQEFPLDPAWVRTGMTVEAVRFTEYFGRYLIGPKLIDDKKAPGQQMLIFVGGMSSSQIRNFFGEVRKLQMKGFANNTGDFAMLRPRLAFAKVRSKENANADTRIKDFEQVLTILMDNIESGNAEHFQNFVDFLEATVAYHKANGGKN